MKPYKKAQTVPYVGLQDLRRKLTDDERAEILKLHDEKGLGCRTIGKMFGVSRSLVRIICIPEVAERNRARIKATWRKYREQRGKLENAANMRKFRARKYKMFMRGELTEKPTPPVVRQKIETTVINAKTPDGRRKSVRIPLSFATAPDGAEHVGRIWRTVRRDGKFFVFPISLDK